MDKKFEFLPHTADAKFRAYGKTLEEAVANAALAMVSLMWDYDQVELKAKEEVEIKASSFESLMVKFLTEILYLFEVKRFLLGKVEQIKLELPDGVSRHQERRDEKNKKADERREDNTRLSPQVANNPGNINQDYALSATLAGDYYSDKYEIISEVKAATYNDFVLEKVPDGFSLQMVVDM
ncbi:MAG: archease [Candidatus Saccharicenans sp.]|nr:MAG: hypothetical protein C0168_09680 [Candidatus Aminicenantes bacterium]HEK86082.1 archease [Candidatus Aminicenantes bacterium]